MELLFTDEETFFHEEKRDIGYDFQYIDENALAIRVTRTRSGRAVHCDQGVHHRSAPCGGADECEDHGGGGGAFAAEVLCAAGAASGWRAVRATRRARWILRGRAACWRGRTSFRWRWERTAGLRVRAAGMWVRATGTRICREHLRMTWNFGQALNGNIAVMGEIDCDEDAGVHRWRLRWGEGNHSALSSMMQSLSIPF